jgi:ferredoxin--NADP+ reductase
LEVKLLNYKIAIVGAGPAGYFAAQAFQKAQNESYSFSIDLIERLPTPWGLVRSGVAPDHQKIKSVSKVFEKIARESNFRLFANVELGKDVSLRDLRDAYDAVVLATGCSVGRKLGIKGEKLFNCISSAIFVPWYNAHPDFIKTEVDFNTDTAVVIGAGNVALDVARILSMDPDELETTDISDRALKMLKSSKITKVIICARRGPEHAAFTTNELRTLSNLTKTNICIDELELEKASSRVNRLSGVEKDIENNLEAMSMIANLRKKDIARNLEIKFFCSPIEIIGNKKVKEIIFAENELRDGQLFQTEKTFSIKAGLVITAIGYDITTYPGVRFENDRILNIAGHVEHNIYVTGWAKRGPVGLIGTNKSDSSHVVELIIENLKDPKGCPGIDTLLKSGHPIVDQIGWEKINASEVIAGQLAGKPRIKEENWNSLISLGTSK